jgi:hypothetical protein
MSEYRIEKVRRRVTIVLSGGETFDGDVFLQPAARYRYGPQDPAEMFNEPDRFVPLAIDGGEVVLLAKEGIVRVLFDEPDLEPDGVEGSDAMVEVAFLDGSRYTGVLRFQTRVNRSRLIDFLNEDNQRFLTLRSGDGVCLVNRTQVIHVRRR